MSALNIDESLREETLEIYNARENNLKNISLTIPRYKLVVITGLSGSGKSSLAFDTIYAEGQRRYMETFSSYARRFVGDIKRPEVDKITGLSPVISIEQKTVHRNPRSTVGTITEIYDFLRLLYARASTAYSYISNEKMVRYTEKQIVDLVMKNHDNTTVQILAPVVKARKGHYREIFEQVSKWGFLQIRVDGKISGITPRMQVDRYKTHDIEIVIDNLTIHKATEKRLTASIGTALRYGNGFLMILDQNTEEIIHYSKFLICPQTGISYPEPEPNTFSFNSPYGYCPHCKGLGYVSEVNMETIIPKPELSIKKGGIAPLGLYKPSWIFKQIDSICHRYDVDMDLPVNQIPEEVINDILYGTEVTLKIKNETAGTITQTSGFEGIVNFIINNSDSESVNIRKWATQFMHVKTCHECKGGRLRKESTYFRIGDKNIVDLAEMDMKDLWKFFNEIDALLTDKEKIIASEIIREIKTRLGFLLNLGVDYLTLNRGSKTLSGGEAQRIRLATQIGSKLVNVLYILDEPSIGLHQRDNQKLINSLQSLRDIGNSILVVEHDYDTMRAADHIIDVGPAAGIHGGLIVAQGTFEQICNTDSLTAQYLSGRKKIKVPTKRRQGNGWSIELFGASGHNLKNINAKFPLGKFICITGVSGSGKSSLISGTLTPLLHNHVYRSEHPVLPYTAIEGLELIDKIIEINQQPIGRTSRSNPITYIGCFGEIRKLYAALPEAKLRHYQGGRFSFNVAGGRCEVCKGMGVKTVEMGLLPEVHVRCEVCNGKRYNRETLEIRYKGKSINDVLEMTFDEAIAFFEPIPAIRQKLKVVQEVGLGYLHLGQNSTTLSGGEAQRIKLSSELGKIETGKTFYILDEPTTGLHFEDIRILLNILNRLVDKGNTVLVIEHNMDVIKMADHIIDLGAEGGQAGGYIVAEGTPQEIARCSKGYTGKFLKEYI